MLLFFCILFSHHVSHILEGDFKNCLNTNVISHIGFYNFTTKNACQITALLNFPIALKIGWKFTIDFFN